MEEKVIELAMLQRLLDKGEIGPCPIWVSVPGSLIHGELASINKYFERQVDENPTPEIIEAVEVGKKIANGTDPDKNFYRQIYLIDPVILVGTHVIHANYAAVLLDHVAAWGKTIDFPVDFSAAASE